MDTKICKLLTMQRKPQLSFINLLVSVSSACKMLIIILRVLDEEYFQSKTCQISRLSGQIPWNIKTSFRIIVLRYWNFLHFEPLTIWNTDNILYIFWSVFLFRSDSNVGAWNKRRNFYWGSQKTSWSGPVRPSVRWSQKLRLRGRRQHGGLALLAGVRYVK